MSVNLVGEVALNHAHLAVGVRSGGWREGYDNSLKSAFVVEVLLYVPQKPLAY